jgi:hypothetical protein
LLTEFDALSSDGERIKHVYASYGLAVYLAQCLESGLINLSVVEGRVCGEIHFRHEADALDEWISRKTLGAMLIRMKSAVEIDQPGVEALDRALRARNALIHGFFYRHALQFMNKVGQRKMLEELSQTAGTFKLATVLVDTVTGVLFKVLGISQEQIDQEYNRLHAEVL